MIATAGVNLLEAAVLLEDQGTAALLASHLRPVASVAYSSPVGTCVARHLGAAAALLGDGEAARAYYAQALEVTSKLGFRPEIALTHLGIAELLLDEAISSPRGGPGGGSVGARHAVPVPSAAQRNEALQHLHFAIAELRDMKMEPALQRALQLEKRATEPTPLRRVAAEIYPDGLSEREVEVLRLLAAGRSNREIGGQLYISLNTVARHVNHIFVKVGVANRVEAAAYAHRLGLV